MDEKYTFFWNGPFSQWDASPFMDLTGLMYNCCEQAMMAHKAMTFKDEESFKKIMGTTSPREQKALGRKVKNFNPKVWDVMSSLIVYDMNLLKFSQNKKHQEALLKTGDTILVEASPYDKIWGVSMSEDDSRINDMSQWKGQNRLGFILTRVREVLKDEMAHQDIKA